MITILLEMPRWLIPVLAALLPAIGLVAIILSVVLQGKPKATIITTQEPIRVVGLSVQTTKATFYEDDAVLWREFKQLREKNSITNKKEEHSFISVIKPSTDGKSWEYMIGCIVNDFSQVPEGTKIFEIPVTTYAAFVLKAPNERRKWAAMRVKMEKFIHKKWLPKSHFALNSDVPVLEIEYHHKPLPQKAQKMIFYVPIKPKSKQV
jgi:predicted transcriptional regulator YdeE